MDTGFGSHHYTDKITMATVMITRYRMRPSEPAAVIAIAEDYCASAYPTAHSTGVTARCRDWTRGHQDTEHPDCAGVDGTTA